MAESFNSARSELIRGGQRSSKSPTRQAVLIALVTAAGDSEMAQRIARQRQDRAERVPQMITAKEPVALSQAVEQHSQIHTLVLVGYAIGLGVIRLRVGMRAFVGVLGLLNQQVGAVCERVPLMAVGLPLTRKGAA